MKQQKIEEHESSMSDANSDDETTEDRRIIDGTPTGNVVPRRSTCQTHPPVKFRDYALMTSIMNVLEPLNQKQAKDKEKCVIAMNEEYNSIMRNKTWDLVELPKDKVPIGSKWIFKSKLKDDGSMTSLRKYQLQRAILNKTGLTLKTYAPVAKLNNSKLLVALATKHNRRIHQLDVKSAFLNGDLKEEVYLQQPKGFV